MNHARTRRLAAGAVVVTLLAGLGTLLSWSPSQAVTSSSGLEVSPEVRSTSIRAAGDPTSGTITLTARLVNKTTGAAEPLPATGPTVTIDFEYIGGPADTDGGDSPATPDATCTVLNNFSNCTRAVTGAVGAAGTTLVRAWVHEPDFVNDDRNEARLSDQLKDCNTETDPEDFQACQEGDVDAGFTAERDQTDLVSVTFSSGPTRLNCSPETQSVAFQADTNVTCVATDNSGNTLPNQRIDGENLDGANDPDVKSGGAGNADYDGDTACVTGDNGSCSIVVQSNTGGDRNNQTGNANLCFWIDSDNDSLQPANDTFEPAGDPRDGGGCGETVGAAENDDITDVVTVTWADRVLTSLDVTPEVDSSVVGSLHTLTARALDQFGAQWTTPVTVRFEVLANSPGDQDGSTPNAADLNCSTPGTGGNPGQCTVSYTSLKTGTDTICAWSTNRATPNATCEGETQAGNEGGAFVDVVVQGWTAAPTSTTTTTTTPPAEDVAKTQGYSLVGADGGIFNYGTSSFKGSMGDQKLNQPVIGMANKKGGTGYWLVAKDGGIFTFGDAEFLGSLGDKKLNAPILGMEATPTGKGYWLFAADGGIFSFGDANFYGSTGDMKLNAPAVGMAINEKGDGYWLVAQDGGIFSFGNVPFYGSTGDKKLNQPVFDMASTAGDKGYWLVAKDGGIFSFGDAENKFAGSAVGSTSGVVIGMGATPTSNGYWIADNKGAVFPFGDAKFLGDRRNETNNATTVGFATVPKK